MGQITSNSFMKREFGKKLIEEFFAGRDGAPGVDLTHVIDTSGAYIPGHGTPTVILFGRNRKPVAKTIRAVMGIRGEPSTPDDPAQGLVWSAIVAQIDQPGSQSEFVSVADSPAGVVPQAPLVDRRRRGGGTEGTVGTDCWLYALGDVADSIGITCFTLEDDVFISAASGCDASWHEAGRFRTIVVGDAVRDWT